MDKTGKPYGLSPAEVDECRASAFIALTKELEGEGEKSLDDLDVRFHAAIINCRYWAERAEYLLNDQLEVRRKR